MDIELDTGGGIDFTSRAKLQAINDNVDNTGLFGKAMAGVMARLAGFNGVGWDRLRHANVFKSLNAAAIGTEATIWTPAGGKKFRLMGFVFSAGVAAGNIVLKDNTAGATILVIPKAALDTPFISPPMGNGILSAAANNVLTATGVATETLSGFAFGTEE